MLLAFLLAVLFTPLAIKAAFKFKILDIPNDRKLHSTPLPRLGGAALLLAFLIAAGTKIAYFPKELIGLLAGLALVFLAGFLDDLKSKSAAFRLCFQSAAVVVLIISGVHINILPAFPGALIINYLLTFLWVIGIINAVNYLDGVDGLAAGLGVISGLSIFVLVSFSGPAGLGYLILAFTGACAGFLIFNFKPAKIFLGDSGSSIIGYLLAVFSIFAVWNVKSSPSAGMAAPLLILGIPIFDMLYTTVNRIKNGSVSNIKEWLEFTGKDHIHHRLISSGISQKNTVIFFYGINLILGISAVLLPIEPLLLLLPVILCFALIISIFRRSNPVVA